jgi:hypothetical protein
LFLSVHVSNAALMMMGFYHPMAAGFQTLAFQFASKGEVSLGHDKQINTSWFSVCGGIFCIDDLVASAVDFAKEGQVPDTDEMELAGRTCRLTAGDDYVGGWFVPADNVHP